MNATRLTLLALATTVGTTIGAALWYQARESDLDRYEHAVVARLAMNRRLAARALASATNPPAESPKPQPPSAASDSSANPHVKNAWISRAMSQMPGYKAWQRGNWQVAVMRQYGAWLATLNVSAARREEIKAALLDHITARQERYNALTASGLSASSNEFGRRVKQDDEALMSQLQQALTPDEYSSFRRYGQTEGWVRRFPEINMFLADRGAEPLSAAQQATLVDIFAEAKAWTPPTGLPYGTAEQQRTARIAELARQRIDGPQREAFVAYIAFVNERARIAAQLIRPDAPDSVYPWSSPPF